MRHPLLPVLAVVGLVVAGARVAGAANIATYIAPQPDAPIQITGCHASMSYVDNGWGTSVTAVDTGVSFRNDSPKTAVAVLVRFELENAFGDVLGSLFGQSAGHFSTGAVIDGNKWSATDTWPSLSVVRCSLKRILFADGSSWPE